MELKKNHRVIIVSIFLLFAIDFILLLIRMGDTIANDGISLVLWIVAFISVTALTGFSYWTIKNQCSAFADNEPREGLNPENYQRSDIELDTAYAAQQDKAVKLLNRLSGVSNHEKFSSKLFSLISKEIEIVQGVFFLYDEAKSLYCQTGGYAMSSKEDKREFTLGEGLVGQVARNQELTFLDKIPENYITILSGSGFSSPKHLAIVPIVNSGKTIGLLELAMFSALNTEKKAFLQFIANDLNQYIDKLLPVES